MTDNLDLTQLREVAEEATPGPWEAKPYLYGVQDGRIRVTSPSDDNEYNLVETVLPENAAHIATFDPPTVLALIDRVEKAEQGERVFHTLSLERLVRIKQAQEFLEYRKDNSEVARQVLRLLDGGDQK